MASKITIPDLKKIRVTDPLFSHYAGMVAKKMIPVQWEILNGKQGQSRCFCIDNFRIAGGTLQGEHRGVVFGDTDAYKWLEAVAYCANNGETEYIPEADELIEIIGQAQQPDGYLNTYFTVCHPELRWKNLTEGHELYSAGHLIEAAVAYYNATGKRRLLDIAAKFADLICQTFGDGEGQIPGYPGHQEIELALVKLWRVTGEERYLKTARFFIDCRGRTPNYLLREMNDPNHKVIFPELRSYDPSYSQSHVRPVEQKTMEGHAVRAMYQCSAMADLADIQQDEALRNACQTLWDNVTKRRMYITGGIGSSGLLERFTVDYDLPNDRMYCESCASIGLMMFGQRMAAMFHDASYYETVERALCNTVLGGVSAAGDRYFYVNPLESNGDHHRQAWYGCACCPSQISRFLPSIGNYIYGTSDKALWVNLFIGNTTEVTIDGKKVVMKQETDYPWDGLVKLTVTSEQPLGKELRIRIPGWCKSYTLSVNGNKVDSTTDKGYTVIKEWKTGDLIVLNMDMPVEKVSADPRVRQNTGKRALQRGPLVYCLEETDNAKDFADLALTPTSSFEVKDEPDNLGGIRSIKAISNGQTLHFIPYYAWDNRKAGKMKVWIDYQE